MNRKTEEMIALGVAYGINCTACMEYHKKEAIQAGLTEDEMLAAIAVAKQVKAGPPKRPRLLQMIYLEKPLKGRAVLLVARAAHELR